MQKANFSLAELNFANVFKAPFSTDIEIYLAMKTLTNIAVVTDLVMRTYPREGAEQIACKPIKLSQEAAQGIMDGLYERGFRSQIETKEENRLLAVENHLEDMRQIAFKKLSIEKPNVAE